MSDELVKTEGQAEGQTEGQPKQEAEGKEEAGERYFALDVNDPTGGNRWNVTGEELVNLAKVGAQSIIDAKRKPKEEETVEEEDNSSVWEKRFAKLETEFEDYKKTNSTKEQNEIIQRTLHKARASDELTAQDDEMAEAIGAMALAHYSINPRVPLEKYYADVSKLVKSKIDKAVEKVKTSLTAESNIRGRMNGTIRGGTVPTTTNAKQFKADDLRTGAARRAFLEYIARAEQSKD